MNGEQPSSKHEEIMGMMESVRKITAGLTGEKPEKDNSPAERAKRVAAMAENTTMSVKNIREKLGVTPPEDNVEKTKDTSELS